MEFPAEFSDIPRLVFLVIGFCAGTIAAFFGVGGGIIMTPIFHAMGLPMAFAVALSTPVVAINAIAATAINSRKKTVNWRYGIPSR